MHPMCYPPAPMWCGCPYTQDYGHACTQLCGCTGVCQYPPPPPDYAVPPMGYPPQGYYPYPPAYQGYQPEYEQYEQYGGVESDRVSSEEGESHSSEGRVKAPRAQLLGILNRFTEAKYAENFHAVEKLIVAEEVDAEMLASVIHDQAVVMPSFAELYARLCDDLCHRLGNNEGISKKQMMVESPFRRALLKKCQIEFEEVIASCGDGSAELRDKQKEKEILSFICALHIRAVVGTQTMLACVNKLIVAARSSIESGHKGTIFVDLLLTAMQLIAKHLAMKEGVKPRVDAVYRSMEELSAEVATRQRFLLQNVLEKRP